MKLTYKKYFLSFSILTCLIIGGLLTKPIISWLYPTISYVDSISPLYIGGGIPVYAPMADAIIIGEVKEVGAPYLHENKGLTSQQDIKIDVKEVIKGEPMTNITLLLEGGYMVNKSAEGKINIRSEGDEIDFNSGEQVLLFLGKTTLGEYVLFAGPYGKYLIDKDNNVVSITDFTMLLEDMKTRIRDILKNPSKYANTPPFDLDHYMKGYSQYADKIILGNVSKVNKDADKQAIAIINIAEVLKGDTMEIGTMITVHKPPVDDMGRYILSFEENEKVLLFLRKTEEGYYEVVPGQYGKFIIDQDKNATGIDKTTIPLEDLKAKIKNALTSQDSTPN